MRAPRLSWPPRKVRKVALASAAIGVIGVAAAGWSGLPIAFQLAFTGLAAVAAVVAIWAMYAREDAQHELQIDGPSGHVPPTRSGGGQHRP
jgi:protein-S-isoprenylcysteine O-methyltransferase Ste14